MNHQTKVLHLGKFYPPIRGGIESFVADLARAQARAGCRDPFVVAHQETPLVRTSYETVDGVKVCRAAVAAHFVYAPIAPGYLFLLRRVLRRFRPDVIHVHVPNVSPFWLLLANPKQPLIIHWHADVVASEIDRRLALAYGGYRPFERALLRRASAVIATSDPYLHGSSALRDFKPKVRMIPLGLDPFRLQRPETQTIRELRARWPGKFLLLAAGRFAYYKGFDVLVEAVRDLPNLVLVIAGDGPHRAKVVNRVRELGLTGCIHLPGGVTDHELHTLMAACDAFCLPSIERTEAFGITLLEAMAFGKPLISTAIPGSGTGWVNQDGETGIVVPPRDPAALGTAVEWLMKNPEKRAQMGQKAIERFQTLFHIDSIEKRIAALYHSTLHTPPTCG